MPDARKTWDEVLADAGAVSPLAARGASANPRVALPDEHHALYRPLLRSSPDRPFVVAHLAQSLDGCVALRSGESQWITGTSDLDHTHRLRALVDAVVVGVQTVIDDDPLLTVRRCAGVDPVRVVVDPNGRAHAGLRVFQGGTPTLRLCKRATRKGDVELPADDGMIAPSAIIDALFARGMRRILIEGGGVTVSRFLRAGCVDRLHLAVAPMLIGDGRRGFPLPLCEQLRDAIRFAARPVALGQDWLFDCDLRA